MSCGIPLSGAAMISANTAAASFSRFTGSLPLASRGAIARVAARIMRILIPLRSIQVNLTRVFGRHLFLLHESRQLHLLLSRFAGGCVAGLVWSQPGVERVTAHGQVTKRGQRPRSARQCLRRLLLHFAHPPGADWEFGHLNRACPVLASFRDISALKCKVLSRNPNSRAGARINR